MEELTTLLSNQLTLRSIVCFPDGETFPIYNEYKDSFNKNIIFNQWTIKSDNVPFKSQASGIGDGEEKIAAEFDTKILGQNSSYDMKIIIDGIEYKCDIKKLDKNTFNTGVKARNLILPIKQKITELLNLLKRISNSIFFTEAERREICHFENITSDELCVSNIKKLNDICHFLNGKRNFLLLSIPKLNQNDIKNRYIEIILNDIYIDMTLYQYYNICLILNQDFPSEFEKYIDELLLLKELSQDYIINPSSLKESLDNTVSIFKDLKLIFVDEEKGFCIFDDIEKISFERITRGNPRFRVHLEI